MPENDSQPSANGCTRGTWHGWLRRTSAALIAVSGLLAGLAGAQAQPSDATRKTSSASWQLAAGDAVISGFSGIVRLSARPETKVASWRRTFIDTDGVSLRVMALGAPGFIWDGRQWSAPVNKVLKAADVGQVFGIALDDANLPNVYFTATSAFGLHIIGDDRNGDGLPDRLRSGRADARFMPGQWGSLPQAGPGSIYVLDGRTAEVRVLANITLDGELNSGPGLGNIAYDRAHRQLFVSDRDTGMIHRVSLDGVVIDHFDHGVEGRAAANLAAVPHDAANRADITSPAFDVEDPATWGLAAPLRRTFGLAVHGGRLYYAVARGESGRPEVWSVGLHRKTGAFLNDPRFELALPEDAPRDEVSDIAFSRTGAMIIAQRGKQHNALDYQSFAGTGDSRVYRFWPEWPDDPKTPARWHVQPEEHPVGFRSEYRNTNGGIALGYGYDRQGRINRRLCEGALWSTGEALRQNPDRTLRQRLKRSGKEAIIGVQGAPFRPARPVNTPPWRAYFVDYDGKVMGTDVRKRGWMGDVEVYTPGCTGPIGKLAGIYTPWNYDMPQAGTAPDMVDGEWVYPPEAPPTCTWEDGCIPGLPPLPRDDSGEAPQKPELKVVKQCQMATPAEDGEGFTATCTITISGNDVPPTAPLQVSEVLSGTGQLVSWASAEPWLCGPATPLSAGQPLQCQLQPQDFASAGFQSTITVQVQFANADKLEKAQNCASLGMGQDDFGKACQSFPAVKVVKEKEHTCNFGQSCTYTITVTNLWPNQPYNGPVVISDQTTGATMTITSINPPCAPQPTQTPFACSANVSLPLGGSQTFTVTGFLTPGAFDNGNVEVSNCAGAGSPPADTSTPDWWKNYLEETPSNDSCVKQTVCAFSCHMSSTGELEVEKQLKGGDCKPGGTCTYTIMVRNMGNSAWTQPISLVESLPNGATFVSVQPSPPASWWTCAPNNTTPANDLVCKHPPALNGVPPLAAGGTTSFDITIAIPAGFEDEEIRNCVGFDLAPGNGQRMAGGSMRARMMRKLGVTSLQGEDAKRKLARYLLMRGMPEQQSRKMAEELLQAASVSTGPATGNQQSCVSTPVEQEKAQRQQKVVPPVVLPPKKAKPQKVKPRKVKPERPVLPKVRGPRCDRRSTVRKGNRCVCRFGGARKVSATRCTCPRGTKLNPKRGRCERVRQVPKCRKPAFLNRKRTACLCPRGWRRDGRNGCRKIRVEPPRPRCVPPAFPVRGGKACACPPGWRKLGPRACFPRFQPPREEPQKPHGDYRPPAKR